MVASEEKLYPTTCMKLSKYCLGRRTQHSSLTSLDSVLPKRNIELSMKIKKQLQS